MLESLSIKSGYIYLVYLLSSIHPKKVSTAYFKEMSILLLLFYICALQLSLVMEYVSNLNRNMDLNT